MCRPSASDSYYRISRVKSAEEEFERANFVAADRICTEIIALDPQHGWSADSDTIGVGKCPIAIRGKDSSAGNRLKSVRMRAWRLRF